MGLVAPAPGFLEGLRAECDRVGALLIFDEVITGFRVARGGAQELLGVTPDLTTFGKVIGGGLPVGAFGGRAEIMDVLAPLGPVYQAGTLSGNPLATAAGLAALGLLDAATPTPSSPPRVERFAAAPRRGHPRRRPRRPGAAWSARWSGLFFGDELAGRLRLGPDAPTRRSTPPSSTRCSTAASPSPPAPTRCCSPGWPTPTPSSTRSSPSPPTRPPPSPPASADRSGRSVAELSSRGRAKFGEG